MILSDVALKICCQVRSKNLGRGDIGTRRPKVRMSMEPLVLKFDILRITNIGGGCYTRFKCQPGKQNKNLVNQLRSDMI